MTRVLSEVYPYTVNGMKRFCLNRFLRIYPTYYAILLLNIACIYYIPPAIVNVSTSTHMPITLGEWVANLSIFGITQWYAAGTHTLMSTRLVNNVWSLNIELWFYIILSLFGAMRRLNFVILWVIIGVLQVGYSLYHGYDFQDRYSPITAGILPFGVGSLLYYLVKRWPCPKTWNIILCCFAISAWGVLPFIYKTHPLRAEAEGLYISLIISAVIIYCLANFQSKCYPRWAMTDKWLGNLSYSIFLCHFTAGIIMKWIFPSALDQTDGSLFLAALPLIHLMAWLLYIAIQYPLEHLRKLIHDNRSFKQLSSKDI